MKRLAISQQISERFQRGSKCRSTTPHTTSGDCIKQQLRAPDQTSQEYFMYGRVAVSYKKAHLQKNFLEQIEAHLFFDAVLTVDAT